MSDRILDKFCEDLFRHKAEVYPSRIVILESEMVVLKQAFLDGKSYSASKFLLSADGVAKWYNNKGNYAD